MAKIPIEASVRFRAVGMDLVTDSVRRILSDTLDKAIKKAASNLKRKINRVLVDEMRQDKTFISIADENNPYSLRQHFGLDIDEAKTAQEDILRILRDSTEIKIERFRINKASVTGSLEVEILPADLKRFITMRSGTRVSDNGYHIDWMEWLLTRGVSTIWPGYGIQIFMQAHEYSRAGYAIMAKAGPRRSSYSVPSPHAGTIGRNFIRRVVNRSANKLEQIVKEEIEINL